MKRNKRLLTIGILAVLTTTTLTGCAGGKWNPGNWDWSWTKYLNPLNWEIFKGQTDDQVSEDVEVSENTETSPDGLVKKIDFEVNKAFGEAGKKIITLILTPANADIGEINWTSNNAKVIVTKIGDGKTAEVYSTAHLAKSAYATITATESLSGVSASGKVYSLKMPDVVNTNIAPHNNAIWVNTNTATTGKPLPATGTTFASIKVEYETDYQQATLSIAYHGSFAPIVKYKGLHQGGTTQTATAQTGGESSESTFTIATYNIYIFKGDPSMGNQPIIYSIYSPATAGGPDSTWTADRLLYEVKISTATNVSGASMPDLTIYA